MRPVPEWCDTAASALQAALVSEPNDSILGRHGLLIAIDGRTAVGKTTLARFLTWEFNVSYVEGDLFIDPHESEHIHRYDELSRVVASRLTMRFPRPIIVESVTVLRLLDRISRSPDFLIYAYNDEEFDDEHSHAKEMLRYEAEYNPRECTNLLLKIPVPD